jgi:SPP1 gp7 family putative phage head morphogenesis protein
MIPAFGRETLKAALFAHRKKMGRAAQGRQRKPTRWLYPWATERHYAAAIRAWMRPMVEYVHQYIKNNQEAILRGDSATLVRQDATPGGSWRRMVASLNGWYKTYIPELDDSGTRTSPPVILMGLGNIAETMNDFNEKQWEKAAKAELGVEFPMYEDWWPETKKFWQEQNYGLIRKMSGDYISMINQSAEKAVLSGWSPAQLAKEISRIDGNMKSSRANLIARDQIGKLNGQVTQARMASAGLDMYIWSTSGDERVRSSHAELDGKLCRWDDALVYSEDGGKTWKPRTASMTDVHPGEDIQCRCTALSYWDELVGEVDKQIDLLFQDGNNVDTDIDRPPNKTKSKNLKQQNEGKEQKQQESNTRKAKAFADKEFPHEDWKKIEDRIFLSTRRSIGKKSNFGQEIEQARILKAFGSTVYLLPEGQNGGKKVDAIVNGEYMEFKRVIGGLNALMNRFLESRGQSRNVFIKVDSDLSKRDVITSLSGARQSPKYGKYNKFAGGKIILKLKNEKKLIYFNVDNLKWK